MHVKDGTMRVLCTALTLCLASTLPAASLAAQATDPDKLADYKKTMPNATPPIYDEIERLALAANPLGCEDQPHAPGGGGPGGGGNRAYLWQRDGKPQILEDYDRKRAFYGCLDWHS